MACLPVLSTCRPGRLCRPAASNRSALCDLCDLCVDRLSSCLRDGQPQLGIAADQSEDKPLHRNEDCSPERAIVPSPVTEGHMKARILVVALGVATLGVVTFFAGAAGLRADSHLAAPESVG